MTVTRLPVAALALTLLAAAGCGTDPEYAKQEYLKSGDRYVAEQKYNEAVVQYRNALQQDAKFAEARLKLAQTYEKLNDPRNAFREYVRAADLLPDNVEAQLKSAAFLLASRQFEDAKARAVKALAKDPKNVDAQVILGNALAGLKNFDEAVTELEEAVRLDPNSAVAYASLGAAQASTGSKQEAEAAFRKAVETNPNLSAAHLALAQFLWSSGRPKEAESSLLKAAELDPGNSLAHRALAAFYIGTRRPAEAEPHLKSLAGADQTASGTTKLGLADYYLAMNRPDDAMKVLEGLAAQKGSASAAQTRIAAIDFVRKQGPQAHKVIDEVLQRDPKYVPALLVKARFLLAERKIDEALAKALAATASDRASIQAHYLVGSLYRLKNERDKAIASFTEVLKLNPQASAAQFQLAQLNLARGDAETGVTLAQSAAKTAPGNPAVQLTLARGLLMKRQTAQAERIARALVARFPKSAAAHSLAGSVAAQKRDLAGARASFSRALELDPSGFEPLRGLVVLDLAAKKPEAAWSRIEARLKATPDRKPDLALSLLAAQVRVSTGKLDDAEALLGQTIENDPTALQAYGMLGRLYASRGKLDAARTTFEEILKREPESVPTHTMLAIIAESQGKTAEARQRYERILKIDPNAAVAANNLAYMYAEEGGNLDLALQLAQTAKQKLPEAPEITDTVGWVYYKKELPSIAIPLFQQAARKDPNNPIYQYHLGLAQLKNGERLKARMTLEQVLKDSPNAPHAEAARKALASM